MKTDTWRKRFEKKFLYWVVLGSTLNDGNELRWNVGEGRMPSINNIKDFIQQEIDKAVKEREEEILEQVEKEKLHKETKMISPLIADAIFVYDLKKIINNLK